MSRAEYTAVISSQHLGQFQVCKKFLWPRLIAPLTYGDKHKHLESIGHCVHLTKRVSNKGSNHSERELALPHYAFWPLSECGQQGRRRWLQSAAFDSQIFIPGWLLQELCSLSDVLTDHWVVLNYFPSFFVLCFGLFYFWFCWFFEGGSHAGQSSLKFEFLTSSFQLRCGIIDEYHRAWLFFPVFPHKEIELCNYFYNSSRPRVFNPHTWTVKTGGFTTYETLRESWRLARSLSGSMLSCMSPSSQN